MNIEPFTLKVWSALDIRSSLSRSNWCLRIAGILSLIRSSIREFATGSAAPMTPSSVTSPAIVSGWRRARPVCRPTIVRQVAEEFEDDAARAREKVCYFHAGPRFASIISASRQHSIASIGSMPYWNPMDWSSILIPMPRCGIRSPARGAKASRASNTRARCRRKRRTTRHSPAMARQQAPPTPPLRHRTGYFQSPRRSAAVCGSPR